MKTGSIVSYVVSLILSFFVSIAMLVLLILFANADPITISQNINLVVNGQTLTGDAAVEYLTMIFKILTIVFSVGLGIYLVELLLSILMLVKVNNQTSFDKGLVLPILSIAIGVIGNVPFLVGGIFWLIHVLLKR